MASVDLVGDAPVPLTEEDRMESYRKARRQLSQRTLFFATLIALGMLAVLGAAVLYISFARSVS
jgi:hypothetical protein